MQYTCRESTGPYELSSRFLKKLLAREIATPLTELFNYSLQLGVIPSAWKQSHITPIYKGGVNDDPSNYRPISVVPVIAKILEKIVFTHTVTCIFGGTHAINLLHSHQGAYRSGKSTEDILLLHGNRSNS